MPGQTWRAWTTSGQLPLRPQLCPEAKGPRAALRSLRRSWRPAPWPSWPTCT